MDEFINSTGTKINGRGEYIYCMRNASCFTRADAILILRIHANMPLVDKVQPLFDEITMKGTHGRSRIFRIYKN